MIDLIPLPVTTHPERGHPLSASDWRYPRSPAYEAAVTPLLPTGWTLYAVLDGATHPEIAGKDFGAVRDDGRAGVIGIRFSNGAPRSLRASVEVRGQWSREVKSYDFRPDVLGLACEWAEEQIAIEDARWNK